MSVMRSRVFLAFAFSLLACCLVGAADRDDLKKVVAAAERNDADAQLRLGDYYYSGKCFPQNFEEAAKWFRRAANHGNHEAQYRLGVCYANGQGVEKSPEEAFAWIRRAADAGHAEAQNALGLLYTNGSGVKQDLQEASRLFRLASNSGYIEARKNLALCYANGQGVKQDWDEAILLFRSAADAGNADAQYNLGVCHVNGSGVERDLPEGIKWLKLSIQNGYVDGEDSLRLALAEYAMEREFEKWAKDKDVPFGGGEDEKGRTLAHLAATENRLDALKWLKDKGEPLNGQDDDGVTPADIAKNLRHDEMSEWFKKEGIEIRDPRQETRWASDMRKAGIDEKEIRNHAVALMCEAAGKGDVKTLKNVFAMGIDVNSAMKDGSTALHCAVHAKNHRAIKWLKKQKADTGVKDVRGFSPVDYATIRGQTDVLGWLIGD